MLQLEEVLSFEPRWRQISAIVVLLTAASRLQLEKQQELFLQLEGVLASYLAGGSYQQLQHH